MKDLVRYFTFGFGASAGSDAYHGVKRAVAKNLKDNETIKGNDQGVDKTESDKKSK